MKIIIIFLLLGVLAVKAQGQNEPSTVSKVDLKKYAGLWYEIAKIPNRFQEDCIRNTTAEYFINDEGEIEVRNSCIEENGKENVAQGVARVVDNKTNSKLEVSFVSILGIKLFWGDYWIIGLAPDYRYAIVGSPDRKYGWILSRTSIMSKEDLDEAFNILASKGYDKKRFEMSTQN